MAKNKYGLNFDGFLDYAEQLDELGREYLTKAVVNAMTATKDFANDNIAKAMDESKYNFKGSGHSHRRSKESLEDVARMAVEVNGDVVTAYVGADLSNAPESLILALGSPNIQPDTRLRNAIKCKGKIGKQIQEIQQMEFMKVIEEAMQK